MQFHNIVMKFQKYRVVKLQYFFLEMTINTKGISVNKATTISEGPLITRTLVVLHLYICYSEPTNSNISQMLKHTYILFSTTCI